MTALYIRLVGSVHFSLHMLIKSILLHKPLGFSVFHRVAVHGLHVSYKSIITFW